MSEPGKKRDAADDKNTKEKIISVATKLFATKGYGAVSIRDIAHETGIKPASIYYHFTGKEALLETIMLLYSEAYGAYFKRSIDAIKQESTLEGVMKIIFSELLEVNDYFTYYCSSILLKEQFHNEFARQMAFKLYYTDSIKYIQSHFEGLAEKKVIEPFDSKMLAVFLMFCVLIGSELRLHESMGAEMPFDCTQMYTSLRSFITEAVKLGLTGN